MKDFDDHEDDLMKNGLIGGVSLQERMRLYKHPMLNSQFP